MHRRVSSPRLAGRATELAGLVEALAEVAVAGSAVALVAGEPGAGKTRLITEFGVKATAAGAMVLVGGCVRLAEAAPPYIPVAQALDQLPGTQAGFGELLVAAVEGEPSAAHRSRLFGAVTIALAAAARTAPVALVLEDAHWADQSTLDLVGYLVHALREARVLIVVTYRLDEVDRDPRLRTWLVGLRRATRAFTAELNPLTDAEVAEQIEGILGTSPAPDLLAAVTARADGNPFYVEELVAARLSHADALPPSLRDVLVSRLEALPPRSRHLLRVCAVAGRQVEEPVLRAVLKVGASALAAAVRPALAHHLLRPLPNDGGYEFRHELVREAADAELLPGERIATHAAIASWLAEQQETANAGQLSRIAHHWCAADDYAHAVPALAAAGTAAFRASGFEEAYAQLAVAVDPCVRGVPHVISEIPRRPSERLHDAVGHDGVAAVKHLGE
jgi:predicted ATPase